jgi:hypothetical protein
LQFFTSFLSTFAAAPLITSELRCGASQIQGGHHQ